MLSIYKLISIFILSPPIKYYSSVELNVQRGFSINREVVAPALNRVRLVTGHPHLIV